MLGCRKISTSKRRLQKDCGRRYGALAAYIVDALHKLIGVGQHGDAHGAMGGVLPRGLDTVVHEGGLAAKDAVQGQQKHALILHSEVTNVVPAPGKSWLWLHDFRGVTLAIIC